jgi:hypothetical protein
MLKSQKSKKPSLCSYGKWVYLSWSFANSSKKAGYLEEFQFIFEESQDVYGYQFH